jgi:hypothetical protein
VRLVALASVALALLVPSEPTPLELGRGYVVQRQQPDGGFGEPEGTSDPALTAWAVVAIRASGRDPSKLRRGGASPAEYLASRPVTTANELALRILALDALGEDVREPADRLAAMRRPDGRIGPLVNSTIWGVIALRATGRAAPAASVRYLLRRQHASGGWSWAPGGAPDSNDTAAAIQALRAANRRSPGDRVPPPAAEPGRGVRPRPASTLRRSVDRMGDPGVRSRGRPAAGEGLSLSHQPEAAGRLLPVLAPVRDDARLGDRADVAGAGPEAVSAALRRPGSGRPMRPSSTSASIVAGAARHENQERASRSGASTAASTPATTSSSSPPAADGSVGKT